MDRAGTLSESLINESFALAANEEILKAAPYQPVKAPPSTRIGRAGCFIDSCISFIASFIPSSDRTIQQAKHQNAKEAIGALYGSKLQSANFSSEKISHVVQQAYAIYFEDDIKKGVPVTPDKVSAFATALPTSAPRIRDQISEIERQAAQETAPAATNNTSNPLSRVAGATMRFIALPVSTLSRMMSSQTPHPTPLADELVKVKEKAYQPTGTTSGSSKAGSTTSKTASLSNSASSSSSKSAKSETISDTTSLPSGQPALQPLGDALTTLSPGHTLTAKQLGELQQGKAVSTSVLDPAQKQETRFLPTTTVYQLVNVDPKKCTAEQAAKLFADPRNAPTLMGKQCPEATTKNGLTHYKLTNPLGTYYLDAKVETAPLPEHPSGYQVTSSLQQSDLLEKNEGRCTIVPVTVGNKSQLLIIRRLEATLLQDPKVSFMTVPAARVNTNHEEASKSLVTNFKGLIEKQAAAT